MNLKTKPIYNIFLPSITPLLIWALGSLDVIFPNIKFFESTFYSIVTSIIVYSSIVFLLIKLIFFIKNKEYKNILLFIIGIILAVVVFFIGIVIILGASGVGT